MVEEEAKTKVEPLSEARLESVVASLLDDAILYNQELGIIREEATRRYNGEPYGNEEDGRSKIVSRDVRDVTLATVPDLLRVFVGAERAVEFVPRGAEDVALAEQQTDAIDAIIKADNNYAMEIFAFSKDALVREVGVIKAWREEEETVSTSEYSGVSHEEVSGIISQFPDAEPIDVEQGESGLSFKLRKVETIARYRVEAVPPEEFLIDRNARSVTKARIVGHRRYVTISDLVEMGYDQAEMLEHAGDVPDNTEIQARNHYSSEDEAETDPTMKKVEYTELWLNADMDGDGVAELIKVCMAKRKVLRHEPADGIPLFIASPDPEPHTWKGTGVYSAVEDLARIKTDVMRATLDSLAKSVDPDTVYVEGQGGISNINDILNKSAGGRLIGVKSPSAVMELTHEFCGAKTLPILEALDAMRDQRCGPMGTNLDPDALQSTTAGAVSMMNSSMNKRAEMIARVFCEMAIKPLFKYVLKLMIKHQDKPRMLKIRNQWIPVDPSQWKADMDVTVNVAIGAGTMDERRASLQSIAAAQKEIVMAAGPNNPICGPREIRNTLAKLAEMAGHKDTTQFFKEIPDTPAQPPPPPKPSPEELLAQAQIQAIQADVQNKDKRLMFDLAKEKAQDDRERDKQETETILKVADFQQKYPSLDAVAVLAAIRAQITAPRQQVM